LAESIPIDDARADIGRRYLETRRGRLPSPLPTLRFAPRLGY
jgi:hypothetical protein